MQTKKIRKDKFKKDKQHVNVLLEMKRKYYEKEKERKP